MHRKGDENSGAGSRQAPLDLDKVFPQWDRGHKPLFLPVVKAGEHTVVFLRDTCGLKYIVVQFLLCVCDIQDKQRQKEHSLVPALQIPQKVFRFAAIGGKVGRDYVHIVAAADCLFLLLNLHAVKVGDFPLDRLDRFVVVDTLNVQIDDNPVFRFHEVGKHTV